ncbi:MAG: ABC transporter permease [Candidatus Krumholzibacteriia bacterium]
MKAHLIMKREYMENIRKKSFLISTIVAPILMLVIYAIPVLALFFAPSERVRIAVLDRSGHIAPEFIASLTDTLKDGSPKYVATDARPADGDFERAREEAVARIGTEELDVALEMPEDVLETGTVNYVSKNVLNEEVTRALKARLTPIVIKQRFAREGIASDRIAALTQRVRFNEQKITKSGILEEEEVAGDLIIGVVFVMILYFMLISWGLAVQRSVIEEKSSRVIEVMLSSVEPRDMFIGKIFGLGALGFTQIGIWSVIMMTLAFSTSMMAAQVSRFIQISPAEILYLGVFFVLGFLFYASIFTIIGAVCSTEQDAQQLQMFAMLPLIVPLMMMFFVIEYPDSTVALVLSLIPFFTPMLMLARISVAEPPVWQILLSVVILGVSIYGVIVFAAKVFRVGILMYGKRPGLKEIWRWSRYA